MQNPVFRLWQLALLCAIMLVAPSCQAQQASAIHDGDRIVFVGDSITGQGVNAGQNGWIRLIEAALKQSHAANAPTVVALGGSGQGVGTWIGTEKRSHDQNFKLDVPDVDVKETLDKPADVLVIMLGMNDVLSPYIRDDAAGTDKWAQNYRTLIAALRERLHPRVIGLATVTPCTEDADSPKNKAIAELNARLATIATAENALLLPANSSDWAMLKAGRTLRPDFHVTVDMVHPNPAGHVAIAQGMLQGLGEDAARQALDAKQLPSLWRAAAPALPALSYALEPLPTALDAPAQKFQLRYWWTTALPNETATKSSPKISFALPAGWSAEPSTLATPSGTFTLTGTPDHLHNLLSLQGTDGAVTRKIAIDIAPAWRVATANVRQIGWSADNSNFDPAKGHIDADDALSKGENWDKPVELAPNATLNWQRWTPTVNYLGGDKPGDMDFAGVSFFQNFEVGYGARWIYSDRDRSIQFKLDTKAIGDNSHLSLWLNGNSVFEGQLGANKGKVVDAQLKKGWNALVFKSNHLRWQWQFSIEPVENPQDDWSDLRFSSVPQK